MTWGQCEAWSFNPILHSQQNRLQSSYSPYMLFTPIHEWLYKSCGCFRCLESYLWSQHGVWSSYSTEWLNRCCTECMNATVSLPVSRVFKGKKGISRVACNLEVLVSGWSWRLGVEAFIFKGFSVSYCRFDWISFVIYCEQKPNEYM